MYQGKKIIISWVSYSMKFDQIILIMNSYRFFYFFLLLVVQMIESMSFLIEL